MKNSVVLKFAASALVLGLTMVGCKSATIGGPATLSSKAPKAEQQASKLFAQAEDALRKTDYSAALGLIEQAVELSPQDVGYRMLMADLYVRNGRFVAAEASFADVLTLNPANQRAAINLVLAQIANGKTAAAVEGLQRLAETAPAGDIGLAFALAGETRRAVEILEYAARAPEADGRTRQNLALAYALAGDWQKARTVAAQDVSPAELDSRMQQWAELARPQASGAVQVASLLGVTPVADAGLPLRLALAPSAEETRFAEAPPAPPAEPVPAEFAAVGASDPAAPPATEPEESSQPLYAEAVQALVEPEPALIYASAPAAEAPVPAFVPAHKAPRIAGRAERLEQARSGGGFVVQIGAYSSPAAVERAWAQAHKRFPLTGERLPLSTTVTIPGRGTFHRLSVSGFDTHAEASRLCGSIRAKGGACFVRAVAGDAPVQWASRYTRRA